MIILLFNVYISGLLTQFLAGRLLRRLHKFILPLLSPSSPSIETNHLPMEKHEEENDFSFDEEYVKNSRGMKLYTCRWLPKNTTPKALVFLCHGYAMECSISMRGTAIPLTKAGYAVYGVDYEGHGKSSGLQGYVDSFDAVVHDCDEHFAGICGTEENSGKERFLLGESMGGVVALSLHMMRPTFWSGAVLVAPMCKISDEMKPHPFLVRTLTVLCKVIPTWKVVPTRDVIDSSIKSPARRKEVRENQYCYKGRPRLKTGYELLHASLRIEEKLHEVTCPFLVVHGGADTVTDPAVSALLYEKATTNDKTFKLYPDMWHALTSGEPPENIAAVFADIVTWLDARSGGAAADPAAPGS
ncbi:caffeoylshikimate esterase-like [Wolffia australiana]